MIKKFDKFLEEVSIEGNPGIPSEGGKQEGDVDYLKNMERDARAKYGAGAGENPGPHIGRIMGLVEQSSRLIIPHKEALEQLAEKVIRNEFGDILDGVDLDIKFAESGDDVAKFMGEEDEEEEDEEKMQEIKDKDLINKIHKAKLANVLIQGEAKNTKHILNLPEVKEEIDIIFGNNSDRILKIWNDITKLAERLDWLIPVDAKANMMENQPGGMAGAVKVDWVKKEKKEEEEEEELDIDKIIGSDEDEVEEDMDVEYTPTIKARGIDFPMLLHEAVKGILELIASIYQPGEGASEKEMSDARTVKFNVSTFQDEAEDFRTGPEVASALRDFINESPRASYSRVMRLYVYGKMLDPNYMTEEQFLKLFRGILNGSSDARTKVDQIVNEIVSELKEYESGEVIGHDDKDDDSGLDYDALGMTKPDESEQSDYDREDLDSMSEKDLLALMDDALDSGNTKRMEDIGSVLKQFYNESITTQIYLKELNMIKENHQYRNKK